MNRAGQNLTAARHCEFRAHERHPALMYGASETKSRSISEKSHIKTCAAVANGLGRRQPVPDPALRGLGAFRSEGWAQLDRPSQRSRISARRLVGYEPSGPAPRLAERRVGELDNVTIVEAKGEDLHGDEPFDLVMTLDCMHDAPFPDRIAVAIHDHLAGDGTWLIKDMRSADRYEDMLRNPVLAMQYGYSIAGCLSSATSEEGGAALGTMGFTPSVAERIATDAGFGHVRTINLRDDPTHLYYEIRH